MNKRKLIVTSALASLAAMIAIQPSFADNAKTKSVTEKCYGLVKAGMNDCPTASASCAGSSTKDGQNDAFVFMPAGLCEKLVGASLKPKKNK